MKTERFAKDEQGVAFPMAMIVMAILSALMAAFAVLATSEPQIASNQMASTQARALAETGVERALWALSAGMRATVPSGALTTNADGTLASPVPAPYNGTYVSVSSVGGFKVTVADGAAPNEKVITALNAASAPAARTPRARPPRSRWAATRSSTPQTRRSTARE
ncbi:MAG: pilus assembly PilX N-terminal domain-containing protein [Candidatus Rokubacteria bacterium]|nr:pilus assembly PilX N-terminal domain-containing protein [Candidatus Rokubacteria bacterium]